MGLKYEVISYSDYGSLFYLRHDQPHRINSPAKLWNNGGMSWCEYGFLHRIDGPAEIYGYDRSVEYYIRGEQYEN